MKKVKLIIVLLVTAVITILCLAEDSKKNIGSKPEFTIRKVNEQIVLYTIYRGPYEEIGKSVGKLFALAGQKGIVPKGPVQYAYLNNPQYIPKEHWLTEIRIPVDKNVLKLSGSLGEMTDVKMLSAIEMLIAKKSKGQADPSPIYNDINNWICQNGYIGWDSPVEVFLSGAQSGDYSQMESEIMMPVKKIPPEK